MRGYLERQVDPEDRRRMLIALTERGRAAAEAVGDVDTELAGMLTPAERAGLVAGLVALTEIRERMEAEG